MDMCMFTEHILSSLKGFKFLKLNYEPQFQSLLLCGAVQAVNLLR